MDGMNGTKERRELFSVNWYVSVARVVARLLFQGFGG
jgi:hypothetical protein